MRVFSYRSQRESCTYLAYQSFKLNKYWLAAQNSICVQHVCCNPTSYKLLILYSFTYDIFLQRFNQDLLDQTIFFPTILSYYITISQNKKNQQLSYTGFVIIIFMVFSPFYFFLSFKITYFFVGTKVQSTYFNFSTLGFLTFLILRLNYFQLSNFQHFIEVISDSHSLF
ncbi:transmembrane protein, putative (macronuclear) [Tetrahymena thermophila SB210]|uniref:Transmembrane protein, putative n=1 Tax=Tetrahymena thermophila (strain SB210) TaxID=312017 RepID=W7XDL8_TETTS|nr:transmembrane protein, putative [Tetrahymena thermophila SB210]EWS75672.1 transmembrane protein, putative [Tetrahymena thermophila SB210]|eukprot:XP_012651818.1 transmembrane protein, putative [Tetrahymena thermophila SB210]